VGYDDIEFTSCLSIPLSSVQVPKREMGQKALEILVNKISGKTDSEEAKNFNVKLPTKFVIRN
jgi:DNA-binding LacI/PurR family transcriptional regulator